MTELLYLPGFGSTVNATRTVSDQLSEYLDDDVRGIPLRESLRLPQGFFEGKRIISMSGGISAIGEATPESLVAVAPPVPERALYLIKRAKAINAKLAPGIDKQRYGDSWREEIAPHMVRSLKLLHDLSKYNSLSSSRGLKERGSDVTLAYMNDDGLFTMSRGARYEEIDQTKRAGVKVVSVEGQHNDFTHRPVQIMREIAVADSVSFEPRREPFWTLRAGYVPAVT